MTVVVGGVRATLLSGEELIAKIKEGRGLAPAATFEVKQSAVKRQRLVDIADLERHMQFKPTAGLSWLQPFALADSQMRSSAASLPNRRPASIEVARL